LVPIGPPGRNAVEGLVSIMKYSINVDVVIVSVALREL
jgi:hypothetical protein